MRNILTLILLFVAGMCVAMFAAAVVNAMPLSPRSALLITAAIQAVLAFALPAWLTGRMASGDADPSQWLGLRKANIWIISSGILLMLVAMPMLNVVVAANEGMHLPASMQGIEKVLRAMEDAAGEATDIMLSGSSVDSLIVAILVVGLLTGVAEEMFFRGALQRILTPSRCTGTPHLAIWVTAFIFSAVHFQFFGFLPRLLMGAFFGYLYVGSGSLWTAIGAHALNNTLTCIGYWIAIRTGSDVASDIGLDPSGIPSLTGWISLALTIAGISLWWRATQGNKHKLSASQA